MSPAPFPLPEGWTYVRCQLCGEEIGYQPQGQEWPEGMLVLRCFACAAVEEAEQITRDAADG